MTPAEEQIIRRHLEAQARLSSARDARNATAEAHRAANAELAAAVEEEHAAARAVRKAGQAHRRRIERSEA